MGVIVISSCSSGENTFNKQIVCEVNRYKMLAEDLKDELKNAPHDEAAFLETEEGSLAFLDRLIEKQVLLQEAQAQGLDREKDFMDTIENYWEQALLKSLLKKKSEEISASISVLDEEIRDYYEESKEKLSLTRVRRDIERAIRQNKETQAMNEWIEGLMERSRIKVNSETVKKVFSK
jgi:hypothetical protein